MVIKRVLYFFLFLVLCFFTVVVLVNIVVPKILNQNPNRVYDISYDEISFSFFKNSIKIKNANIKPFKDSLTASSMKGSIELIEIKSFHIYDLLIKNRLITDQVQIHTPYFSITSRKKKQAAADNSKSIRLFWEDFYNRIELKNVKITNGTLEIVKEADTLQTLLSRDINIEVKGVMIDSIRLTNPLPFSYTSFSLQIGKTFSSIGAWYKVSMDSFMANDRALKIKGVKVQPKFSKNEFVAKLKEEADYIISDMDSMRMSNTQWGFYKDTLKVQANTIVVSGMNVTFYRDKLVKDNQTKKKLYSAMLRELPFYLTVDSLAVNNANIVYEERSKANTSAGVLTLNSLNLQASNINNFQYQLFSKKSSIQLQSKLYGMGDLQMKFDFNVQDSKDAYQLNGSLSNLDVALASQFTLPTMNTRVSGYMHELKFMINGSDIDANAVLNFDYEKLKVEIMNEKTRKKRFVQSAIANLLLKKNRKRGEVLSKNVYLKRDTSKSIYHQIWSCIEVGLKKTLL